MCHTKHLRFVKPCLLKAWRERARDRQTIAACVASSADGTVRSVFSGMCGDWQHVQRDQEGRNVAQLVRAVSELKAGNDSSFNSRLHWAGRESQ